MRGFPQDWTSADTNPRQNQRTASFISAATIPLSARSFTWWSSCIKETPYDLPIKETGPFFRSDFRLFSVSCLSVLRPHSVDLEWINAQVGRRRRPTPMNKGAVVEREPLPNSIKVEDIPLHIAGAMIGFKPKILEHMQTGGMAPVQFSPRPPTSQRASFASKSVRAASLTSHRKFARIIPFTTRRPECVSTPQLDDERGR